MVIQPAIFLAYSAAPLRPDLVRRASVYLGQNLFEVREELLPLAVGAQVDLMLIRLEARLLHSRDLWARARDLWTTRR